MLSLKKKDFSIKKPSELLLLFSSNENLQNVLNFSIVNNYLVIDNFFRDGKITKTVIEKGTNNYCNLYYESNRARDNVIISKAKWFDYVSSFAILNKEIPVNFFDFKNDISNINIILNIGNIMTKIREKEKAIKLKPVYDALYSIEKGVLSPARLKWAESMVRYDYKKYKSRRLYVSFLDKYKGCIINRYFRTFIDKKGKYSEVYEFARDIIYQGKIYKFHSPKYMENWCKGRGLLYYFNLFEDPYLYNGNLKSVLKNTEYENSGFLEFVRSSRKYTFNWSGYFPAYKKIPQIEKLSKIKGLEKIVGYLSEYHYFKHSNYNYYNGSYYYNNAEYFDFSKDDILDFLKLPNKNYLRLLCETEGNVKKDLCLLQNYQELGLSMTKEDLVLAMTLNNTTYFNIKTLKTIKDAFGITPKKIFKYCISQSKYKKLTKRNEKKFCYSLDNLITMYRDYLNFIKELGYDLNRSANKFPKNLKYAHDEAVELYRQKTQEKLDSRFAEFYNSIVKLHNIDIEEYSFKILANNKEFIKQGQVCHCCVGRGSYYKAMAERKAIIVSISKKDKVAATLEINSKGQIAQLRGINNSDVSDKIKSAAAHYIRLLNRELIFNGKSIAVVTNKTEQPYTNLAAVSA